MDRPAPGSDRADTPRIAPPRLASSVAFRFAALFAGVVLAATGTLVLFLWWSTAGAVTRQTEATIRADAIALTERYRDGGLAALTAAIAERIAEQGDDEVFYLLIGPEGDRITGNLDAWLPGAVLPDGWVEVSLDRDGLQLPVHVLGVELASGARLMVGRDITSRTELRLLLTEAVAWAGLIAIVLAVGGGVLVRRILALRLAAIDATAAAISAGDMSQRVRVGRNDDEFDRLARVLNAMLDRILRLMDGVRDVSNAIAHDLRTPIARVRARLDDAARTATDTADLRAAVEHSIAELDDVVAVFEALLRIAEIEAGARRSAFAGIDLAPVLADLAETYAAVAEERGLHLDFAAPASLPLVCDRNLIQQAVANLLDNALKFSPPGGRVGLTAEATADGARIVVADQGPGIPPAETAQATARFWRGEAARHTPGSGLGLSLVQAVAQLHGGALALLPNRPGLRAELALPKAA